MMNENYAAGLWTLAMARTGSLFIPIPIIIAGIALILLILIMISGYVKASPDTAVIESTGVDLQAVLSGFLAGKAATSGSKDNGNETGK